MIRRIFYFLLVTVLLGGLAGGIAFWSFYALPSFIAQSIKSAPAPVQTVKKNIDPIFSKPYEPPATPAAPAAAEKPEPQSGGKRRQPQVAALLGGLKRA